jgi:RecJ-like exonuclease
MALDKNYESVAARVAMTDPRHLKAWLRDSGRRYIVLRHDDLVDALPWPEGVEAMAQLVEAYRQHRAAEIGEERPCSKCRGQSQVTDGCSTCHGAGVTRRYKTDVLELDEMKDAAEWLVAQIREKDPSWTI